MPELKYVLYRPSSGGAWTLAVSENASYPSAALAAGTYEVVAGDGVASEQVTIPVLTASIAPASATVGDTLTLETNATPARSVQWAQDGVEISGATGATYDTTGKASGEITVTVTDGAQTVTSAAVTLVGGAATLSALTLSASSIAENAAQNAVVGTVQGATSGSMLSLVDDAGGRFALAGGNIVRGPTALDYETATSHQIVIRETLAGATNTPRDTVLALTVTDVAEGAGSITVTDAQFTAGANGTAPALAVTSDTTGTVGAITGYVVTVANPSAPSASEIIAGSGGGIIEQVSFGVTTPGNTGTVSFGAASETANEIHIVLSDGTTTSGVYIVTGVSIDGTAPTISSTSPENNATGVLTGANPSITFSEPVFFGASGTVTLRRNNGGWADVETFDVTTDQGTGDGQVSISGSTLTINPADTMVGGDEYSIQMDTGAVVDASANAFAGIADDTTFSFTTLGASQVTITQEDTLQTGQGSGGAGSVSGMTVSAGKKIVVIHLRDTNVIVPSTVSVLGSAASLITVGGTDANTALSTERGSVSLWEVDVPTGGTGTVSFSGAGGGGPWYSISVFDIANFTQFEDIAVLDVAGGTSNPLGSTVDVTSNGAVLAAVSINSNIANDFMWTGATEVYDDYMNQGDVRYPIGVAAIDGLSAEPGRAVNVSRTDTGSSGGFIALSMS